MFPEGRILDFLIVGAVALMVVGPKDLPVLMRKVGRFVAHMRGMAAEFRASFDEMARQSELDELRREVEAMRAGQPLQTAVGLGEDDATQQVFDDIHASLRSGEAQLHPPMSHQSSDIEPSGPPAETLSSPQRETAVDDGEGGSPPVAAGSAPSHPGDEEAVSEPLLSAAGKAAAS